MLNCFKVTASTDCVRSRWQRIFKSESIKLIRTDPEDVAKQALNRTARKMPVRTRFVRRRHKL